MKTQNNPVKILVTCAMLAAISMVLARFCVIYITPSIRISFASVPIILAGFFFGPLAGAAVGGIADFVGAVALSGLGWMPQLTVGPMIIGACAGMMRFLIANTTSPWRVAVALVPGMVLSNLAWTTYWLSILYGTSIPVLLMGRVPLYLCIMALETIVISILFQSRVFYTAKLWPFVKKTAKGTN